MKADKSQKDSLIQLIIKQLKQPAEYITLNEALQVTGLSEKTLRDHMRGNVTPLGRMAYDRKEFFEYWRGLFHNRQNQNLLKYEKVREILDNIV